MINKDEIRNLIQESDTKAAILAFKKADLSDEQVNTLAIIESTFYQLNQDVLRGIIGSEEKQLRTNRINNNLLELLDEPTKKSSKTKSNKKFLLFALITGLLLILAFFLIPQSSEKVITSEELLVCPTFNNGFTNKILLIPFVNIGNEAAKPHLLLRDEVEKLTIKKNLSTSIQLTEPKENLAISEATQIAQSCDANVIIWGKYSAVGDSIRLILQYHFLEKPEWSNFGDLIVLKDVTELQTGEMTKNLNDAIMSLCTVIAVRQNEQETAVNWLAKLQEKEAVDLKMLSALEK